MLPFNILAKIKHNTREEVKYQRETYRQERRVDEEQPDFIDRDVKTFAQVGTYPERVPLEKCKDAL